MWFKKNKKLEPNKVTTIPKPDFRVGTRCLWRVWLDEEARYKYRLSIYRHDSWLGGYYWREVASGNKAWAEKTKKHYKLEIVDELPTKKTKVTDPGSETPTTERTQDVSRTSAKSGGKQST